MKIELKKVHRNFKLDAVVEKELRRQSRDMGISQTRMIEEALVYWFRDGQRQALQDKLKKVERARRFELPTFTLAR